jgi:hypothetical protein
MAILQTGLANAAAGGGYQIARSLRFNSADSAYLSRTPASNGNRRTWTFSAWVKRSSLGALQALLSAPYSTNSDAIRFEAADTLIIFSNDGTNANLTTTQVFRDVSSWYHIVVAVDTPQATSTNRVKLYVNGTQVTAFGTATYPTQNYEFNINANVAQNIGRNSLTASQYLGGYMAETYFIDGQALTPTSFGETDTATGVWMPKQVTGMTYGTNGFKLTFSDNSNTTAATLGADTSGNSNNWTPNNFSVTAGTGNDSLVDSPTNYGTDTGAGGEVRGNYCTWNPLKTGLTLLNGNLDANGVGAGWAATTGTMYMSSGKWYAEVTLTAGTSEHIGIAANSLSTGTYLGSAADGYAYAGGGTKYNNNTSTSYGATFTTNDVIGIALDMDNGKIWWSKNGVWQASGNPATGVNAAFTGLTGEYTFAVSANGSGNNTTTNFGQRPFAYTAPSGFKALCTQNLPTPAIGATSSTLASKNFDIATYTGTGSSLSITSLAFQPDLAWIKGRSGATDHALYDAVRGVQKDLVSNSTAAETTQAQGVTAFGSTGFTVGTLAKLNTSSATYVGWAFKGANTTVSNTSGSVSSTVSANPTAGISVVGFAVPAGTGTHTIGHGLGVAPAMIITKGRGGTDNWVTFHKSVCTNVNTFMRLNTTDAASTLTNVWGTALPTSSVFGIKSDTTLFASQNAIAYCFAEVAGFSKFGSYTGNGSADGPFAYCGFRPRFIMVKNASASASWMMYDTSRATYNVVINPLAPDLTLAELSSAEWSIDILSNGFKLRTTYGQVNNNTNTFIFMAFAEAPFNYSRAR